jgi:hypothetical protein
MFPLWGEWVPNAFSAKVLGPYPLFQIGFEAILTLLTLLTLIFNHMGEFFVSKLSLPLIFERGTRLHREFSLMWLTLVSWLP